MKIVHSLRVRQPDTFYRRRAATPGQVWVRPHRTLYLRPHRIRSGRQTITVTVPKKPADAGIDPYLLLIVLERFDNVEKVEIER